jgi:hypothetical protein
LANGLPINDPESGLNPADTMDNRDPRFYNDIVIDGDRVIKGSAPADKEQLPLCIVVLMEVKAAANQGFRSYWIFVKENYTNNRK